MTRTLNSEQIYTLLNKLPKWRVDGIKDVALGTSRRIAHGVADPDKSITQFGYGVNLIVDILRDTLTYEYCGVADSFPIFKMVENRGYYITAKDLLMEMLSGEASRRYLSAIQSIEHDVNQLKENTPKKE